MTGFLVVGLAGGLFKVDVVLLIDVAVGLLALREAAVGLVSVDGFVVGFVLDFDIDSGLFVVLETFERSAPEVGSSPRALCDLEDGRSIVR